MWSFSRVLESGWGALELIREVLGCRLGHDQAAPPALSWRSGREAVSRAGVGSSEHLPGLWSEKRPAGPALGLPPPGGPEWRGERRDGAEKAASFQCPPRVPLISWAGTRPRGNRQCTWGTWGCRNSLTEDSGVRKVWVQAPMCPSRASAFSSLKWDRNACSSRFTGYEADHRMGENCARGDGQVDTLDPSMLWGHY